MHCLNPHCRNHSRPTSVLHPKSNFNSHSTVLHRRCHAQLPVLLLRPFVGHGCTSTAAAVPARPAYLEDTIWCAERLVLSRCACVRRCTVLVDAENMELVLLRHSASQLQVDVPNSRTSTASLASGRLTKNKGGLSVALKYVPMSLCSSGQLMNATTGKGGVLSSDGN